MAADGKETGEGAASAGAQRVDKWLFFARVVKSRTLAQKLVLSGGVRVNRDKIDDPARRLRVGDTLTISYARAVRVLKILHPGERRGPASEAVLLYEDLTGPSEGQAGTAGAAPEPSLRPDAPEKGAPRPSKKDRRALARLKGGDQP
ncbi:RNA-binding S4 domain-containing protein [Jiella endophytica]|uniref:RNA-binding S4 domain-containing protein n=1 Tax=Jiella endophytica TaxID=2558362 RepID=A0A4Y8RI19_9HYPH|nr:RNA-binding S4 domain-containing protein [Jiella endophytica]TFF22056.1 RNA-binding S4 domain-containing protein [Jiella endophytica]